MKFAVEKETNAITSKCRKVLLVLDVVVQFNKINDCSRTNLKFGFITGAGNLNTQNPLLNLDNSMNYVIGARSSVSRHKIINKFKPTLLPLL